MSNVSAAWPRLGFARAEGGPLHVSTVRRRVKAALSRARLPDITRLHDMRHTHATLLLKRGHARSLGEGKLLDADRKTDV